jgi:cobalt/nickel transport system permease protein
MHIPDGYFSPLSAASMYAVMLPFWYAASRKVRRHLSGRTVPLMSLFSAVCFVIQMINIPLPGGTTGHATGAALSAIVLSPWPAVLSVSVTLIVQSLFFADGGITAIGANCFNIALMQVFSSYFLYKMLAPAAATPAGKGIAAGVAGYLSLNAAALLTGIELGLQPIIAHQADGTPLYAPYKLSVAVPAMMIGHSIAGLAEALLTALGVAYLHASAPDLMADVVEEKETCPLPVFWARIRVLWILVAILVMLTPLGLLAPGTAWGEWASDQFHEIGLGFIPQGLQQWEAIWSAWFPDYNVPGLGPGTAYVVSAALGILMIVSVFYFITILGRRSEKKL